VRGGAEMRDYVEGGVGGDLEWTPPRFFFRKGDLRGGGGFFLGTLKDSGVVG